MRAAMPVRLSLIWVLCTSMLASLHAAPGPVPVLQPTVYPVPEQYHSGGAYTAIQAAPDGRVYIGTTIYGGYGHWLSFWPATGRFESLADMSTATGERNVGPYAQAKVHTKPAIAPDGRVYFGTKSGGRTKDPNWRQLYPGGHLLVFDPRSRTTTDLGILKPHQSIIAVGVDPGRGLVYALTDPESHLIVYDPRTRTFADRGQFGPMGESPTRYLVVLANGDAFHTLGESAMARYNAATRTIERLPLAFTGFGSYEPPYALTASSDGRRFYGVGKTNGQVYVFEPREREIGVRFLGAATSEGYAPPGTHYTITSALDGTVYYTGALSRGETITGLFILRVGPDLDRPRVVGRVMPLSPPPYVQGATVMRDGTLIVMTAYPLRLLLFQGVGSR